MPTAPGMPKPPERVGEGSSHEHGDRDFNGAFQGLGHGFPIKCGQACARKCPEHPHGFIGRKRRTGVGEACASIAAALRKRKPSGPFRNN